MANTPCEATGARTFSREESRLRRVARRAEQQGYELDEEEQSVLLMPAVPPLLVVEAVAAVEAVAEPQDTAEQSAQVVPAVVQPEVGGRRAAKRACEDELLIEYEPSKIGRSEFALARNIKVGTIDGIFARARKRRAVVDSTA